MSFIQLQNIFPKEEKFGLISQLGGVAVSIVSSISEGKARKTSSEK